jgi:outer membrane protein TolC
MSSCRFVSQKSIIYSKILIATKLRLCFLPNMKILSFFMVAALVGCQSTGPAISQITGNYSGNLLTHAGGNFQKNAVVSDIPVAQNRMKLIDVADSSGATLLSLQFSDLSDSGIKVTSSKILSAPMALKLDTESGCYFGKSSQNVELCASSPEITFDVSDGKGASLLSLVLYPAATQSSAPLETPQRFTLSQAIARAQKSSFQSRIEFEHVIQAREAATAAYLHLAPQLTLPTLVNNLEPGISSLLGAIGDLAPFLLPSRWIEAKEAKWGSRAEQDTERLMKLDMAAQIEGLFYAYDRDRKSLAVYKTFDTRVAAILDTVTKNENSGHLISGSSDTVQAAYNDITHNEDVYGQILTEDRSALAQALGFFNPLAVEDAVIDEEAFPIETPATVDFNSVSLNALERSVEIDQFNDLIAQAKLAKKEEYFDWLDPTANPALGLGASLSSELKIAQSQVNELGTLLQQTSSVISQEALNSVTDFNQAIDNYQDSQSDIVLHEHRLTTVLTQLNSATSVDVFDLCSVIADDLGANLASEEARADYRVARAEVDRLLLQGYYQSF